MNFDLKEMYRYLISHTLPGLLLLVEISLFLYPAHKVIFDRIFNSPVIFILLGYAFSTLLGITLDGIRHFIFDFFVDSCSRNSWCDRSLGFSRWVYERFDNSRKANRRFSEENFKVFRGRTTNTDECMKVYEHFIEFSEEAIWYPYEAYANIVVAMLLGLIILPIFKLSWQFWFMYLLILIALSFEAVLIYKYCSDDQDNFHKAYKNLENK